MSEFVSVAKVGTIAPGKAGTFALHNKLIAVFNVDGQYYAMDDLCPHMGASLGAGFLEGCIVTCPWHAWRFDIRDGTWCDNRKLKVGSYPVRILGEEIQVQIPPPAVPPADPPNEPASSPG